MKKITLMICAVFLVVVVHAQAALEEGTILVNGGFGLSSYGLPVYVGGEYCIAESVTVGGELSYREWGKYSDYSPSITTIAALGNYHVNELLELPSEWDLYGGATLGYSIWSSGTSYYKVRGSGVYFVGQVGGRYYVTDNIAVNLELGGGNYSGGKIGITFVL